MQDAKIMLQKVKMEPYGTDDDSLYEVLTFCYFKYVHSDILLKEFTEMNSNGHWVLSIIITYCVEGAFTGETFPNIFEYFFC